MKTYTEVISLADGISILGIPANDSWTWYVQRGLNPKTSTKTPATSYAEALILAKKAVYNCQHPNLTTVKEAK